MTTLRENIEARKTFAIISHPDAGKTTLTEKLLYFGGMLREAGTVKGKKSGKHAASDWMDVEKERGISVTSSVMEFDYKGSRINILDTPGHEDFSEDTYRTLTAADSATMLIDVAKGVEAQTKKLFKVCRMRGIPIFTFINKLDREGRDPFDLMEELEEVLGIRSCPMNWPIGMGKRLQGIYDRQLNKVELFDDAVGHIETLDVSGPDDPLFDERLDETVVAQFREEVELLDVAGDPYDEEAIAAGTLTPIFFGSAMANFGVQNFLEHFQQMAPSPAPRESDEGRIDPVESSFSGFIFKIQANMNPKHRDRIAFLRITSGKYEQGMTVKQPRLNKNIRLAQPTQFLAQDRDIVSEAYAGDIIGLFDPGTFGIGDTLTAEGSFQFDEMPHFSPELFAAVEPKDVMKHKSFDKGMSQLTEEGLVQLFRTENQVPAQQIIGAVGELQFEVLEQRLQTEYNSNVRMERKPYQVARWVDGSDEAIEDIKKRHRHLLRDKDDRLVAVFESEFQLQMAQGKFPDITFYENVFQMEQNHV
ncbi:peptide chain release factor 3 [Salsuginibacillus halophilus]|uniref:Peptide chain release factor 3 n=1 Tax=Salsuginibacillus halophilus TaxID=517424 RepID=A0A2P8HBC6_9BACI|nr:peptide chain release factor 3 [Salsuginibacillus halophilus]PSL43534.1 peptide chain release factor 3 [Salsuginibacillus halophilus]